jgi:hypothetical protein
MSNANDDGEGARKLLLTVREAGRLMGVGEKRVRTLLRTVPEFPRVEVTPHRVMIPRGRLMQWLGEYTFHAFEGTGGTVVPFPVREEVPSPSCVQ